MNEQDKPLTTRMCIVCKRVFIVKRKGKKTHTFVRGRREYRAVTCSKMCSRIYQRCRERAVAIYLRNNKLKDLKGENEK